MTRTNVQLLESLAGNDGKTRREFVKDFVDEMKIKNAALILELKDDPKLLLSACRKLALGEVVRWKKAQKSPSYRQFVGNVRPFVPKTVLKLLSLKMDDAIYEGRLVAKMVVRCSDGVVRHLTFKTRYQVKDMFQPPKTTHKLEWRSWNAPIPEEPARPDFAGETQNDEERTGTPTPNKRGRKPKRNVGEVASSPALPEPNDVGLEKPSESVGV